MVANPPKRKKRNPPPIALFERKVPSKAHPEGMRRCQRWMSVADAAKKEHLPNVTVGAISVWQCPLDARDGISVCKMHGGGSLKREKSGLRTNPATVRITHGLSAQPTTLDLLRATNPTVAALFEMHRESAEVYNIKGRMAMAQALLDHLISTATFEADAAADAEKKAEVARAAATALGQIERLMKISVAAATIEKTVGPVSRDELRLVVSAFQTIIDEFVPAERRALARKRWIERAGIGAMEPGAFTGELHS